MAARLCRFQSCLPHYLKPSGNSMVGIRYVTSLRLRVSSLSSLLLHQASLLTACRLQVVKAIATVTLSPLRWQKTWRYRNATDLDWAINRSSIYETSSAQAGDRLSCSPCKATRPGTLCRSVRNGVPEELLHRCQLENEIEAEHFVRFATDVDDGEAICLALAKCRKWEIATICRIGLPSRTSSSREG